MVIFSEIGNSSKRGLQMAKKNDDDRIIEFRFNCPFSLREKMIKRLKELNFDRSEVMCEFLEEWLNETKTLVKKSS